MVTKEAATDFWVGKQLEENGIADFDLQGSSVKEIDEALKTASKRGTKNIGRPDIVAVINDFVLIVEDKNDMSRHQKLTDDGVLDNGIKATTDYAVNGACFYAKHVAQNTNFRKVFAVGVSGSPKHHRITPYWVDERGECKKLPDLQSFVSFSPDNIQEYYTRYVLEESTDSEKTTEQILRDAAELHEYLRTYGTVKDQDKPLIVAGILLALDETENNNFSIDRLSGDQTPGMRDGDKIFSAIQGRLRRSNVGPDAKRDKLEIEFNIIRSNFRLNEVNSTLGKTPLKYYTEFLYSRIYKNIRYQRSSEDYLGRFYGEFMSYSGGDGQSLGIILTPKHICDLMCKLTHVGADDVVFDPTCGTGGFLIAAMQQMIEQSNSEQQMDEIKTRQLHGIELQSNMFAVAVTNMILRQDGKSNLECSDFLKKNPVQLQEDKAATVGLMNPPYSQGTTADPSQYELAFVEHLLDSLTERARAAVIIPQSSMTGKTKDEQKLKSSILTKHTLEGVITCNTGTFYGVGVNPVIAVFTAHRQHPADKICKFIDFRDDGYSVHPHVGLVADDDAKDKQQHLLDVWNGTAAAPSKFCVESTVEPEDEWLHSFYYFNDDIPTDDIFARGVGDYLTFEFSMIMQNRGYLFSSGDDDAAIVGPSAQIPGLSQKQWGVFFVRDLFTVSSGKRLENRNKHPGSLPFVGATTNNNGVTGFISNKNESLDGNLLGVNYDGTPCTAFYHPYTCVFSDSVKRLHLLHHEDNMFVCLFFAALFQQQQSKFNYGYKFNERRMLRQKLMVPVAEDGEPDYLFMEMYMKNLLISRYNKIQQHYNLS